MTEVLEELTELEELEYSELGALKQIVAYAGIVLASYDILFRSCTEDQRRELCSDLTDWLCSDAKKGSREFLDRSYTSFGDYDKGELNPDVCVSCYRYFGETQSGRLRYACFLCRHDESIPKDGIRKILEINRLVTNSALITQIVGALIRDSLQRKEG